MAVKTGRDCPQAAPRLHCAESFSRSTLPAVWDGGIAWPETRRWTEQRGTTVAGSSSRRRAGRQGGCESRQAWPRSAPSQQTDLAQGCVGEFAVSHEGCIDMQQAANFCKVPTRASCQHRLGGMGATVLPDAKPILCLAAHPCILER